MNRNTIYFKTTTKCFGMCGCNATASGRCKNCNSTNFIGYDNTGTIKSSSFPSVSPNSDGAICSIITEYIDVCNRFLYIY